ncbi:ATP-binding protein [Paragemmobacter aquarius]|uniref:ATP-binding protein n=1 Tax=Paragemmobacter aquarius TaxID=2169400 RepID=UPI00131EE252|nr:ATP-binding protein [Gemmobacter aquarius]
MRAALQRFEQGSVLGPLGADHRDCVLLVLAEVLNNVAEHAYAGDAGPVAVALRLRGRSIEARVVDRGGVAPALGIGRACDPLALPEGGFGTGLIRTLASGICQESRMGCNILQFRMDVDNVA